MSETIAAISTAPGEAGIGIVRVSGPSSLDIMRRLMKNCPQDVRPRHAYFGRVVNPSDTESEVIDEAIFLYMKEPASYSGEDMLEIQGHGSNIGMRMILRAVLESGADGIRPAEPGEFTKLAFLNGKMDLSQAEAVIDIIKAKTDITLGIAERQREGRLSETIINIRSELLDLLARMAVDIDFPDEDEENVGNNSGSELVWGLNRVISDTEALLDTSSIGRIAREGIRVVIIGKPNAGKSSLMNAILGEGRVIVTDIPGTTRDTVEENAKLGGFPVVLVDTAGLRDTDDKVERIGIERTTQAVAEADIILLVIDGSRKLDEEDDKIIDLLKGRLNSFKSDHSENTEVSVNDEDNSSLTDKNNVIAIINKEDLGYSITEEEIAGRIPGAEIITASLIGGGSTNAVCRIDNAVKRILDIGRLNLKESAVITNERHIQLLKSAISNLKDSVNLIKIGEPVELAELSAHYAYNELGNIIGEEASDEILDTVFSKFCLGK